MVSTLDKKKFTNEHGKYNEFDKYKKKIKDVTGGVKHTIKYLRNPKDRKFLGHTDNTKK